MLIARSIQRPACSAEYTPPAIPSGTTTMNASAPSFAELASASTTNGATAERNAYDWPMSPRRKWPIHALYCVSNGRSTPSW